MSGSNKWEAVWSTIASLLRKAADAKTADSAKGYAEGAAALLSAVGAKSSDLVLESE